MARRREEVALRPVRLLGGARGRFRPLPLAGREGSALPFRLPGVARTYLLTPFVLDEGSGRVAAFLASTAAEVWQGSDKRPHGVVVAATGTPGAFADPPITVVVAAVAADR